MPDSNPFVLSGADASLFVSPMKSSHTPSIASNRPDFTASAKA